MLGGRPGTTNQAGPCRRGDDGTITLQAVVDVARARYGGATPGGATRERATGAAVGEAGRCVGTVKSAACRPKPWALAADLEGPWGTSDSRRT